MVVEFYSWKIQNSWRVHVVWTIFHLEMWKPGLNVGDFVGRIVWILGTITKWNTPIRQTVWDFFGCIYFHQWGLSVKLQLRNLWKISNISSCGCKKSCTMVIFSISNGWFSSLISEPSILPRETSGVTSMCHLPGTSWWENSERGPWYGTPEPMERWLFRAQGFAPGVPPVGRCLVFFDRK